MPALTNPSEVNKKKKAAAAIAKKNAAIGNFSTSASDVIDQIVSNAGQTSTDPTAVATNTVVQNGTIPGLPSITQPAGSFAPNVSQLGNQTYDNKNYIPYFTGLNGQPPLVKMSVDPKTKQPFIGMTNAQGGLDYVAIIGDPTNPSNFKVTSLGQALNDYLANAKANGQSISSIKKSLYESGAVRASEAKQSMAAGDAYDPILGKAIVNKILGITNTNYLNVQSGKQNDFISFSGKSMLGPYGFNYAGTHVSTQKQLLDTMQAGTDLDSFMQEYLGRNATTEETNTYLKTYNQLAAQHPQKVVTTTDYMNTERARTTTGGIGTEEALAIKVGMVSDALRAAGKDPNAISKLGGKVGQNIAALKATANDYGLQYSDPMALQDAIKSIQAGASLQSQQTVLKNLAKVHYKSLASAIDSGVTIRDITNQYSQLHQKYLETLNPIDPLSTDGQKALSGGKDGGLMNMNDYVAYLKQKPEWAKTQNAHEEAANYATTILKQFGLLA